MSTLTQHRGAVLNAKKFGIVDLAFQSGSYTSPTPVGLALPVGYAAGDVLWAYLDGNGSVPATPSGYTSLQQVSPNHAIRDVMRIATLSDALSLSLASTNAFSAAVLAISGYGATVTEGTVVAVNTTSPNSLVVPSVTAPGAGLEVLWGWALRNPSPAGLAIATPAGFTAGPTQTLVNAPYGGGGGSAFDFIFSVFTRPIAGAGALGTTTLVVTWSGGGGAVAQAGKFAVTA